MKKTSSQAGSNAMLWLMSLGLVLYTAFRSVHLVQSTLPPGSAQIMGYAALFGLDAALFIWLIYALYGAETNQQAWISAGMIYFQIVGIVLAVIADTLSVFNPAANQQMIGQVAGWMVPIIIGVNVAAAISCKFFSNGRTERMAELDFDRTINDQIHAQMQEHAPAYAASVSTAVAATRIANRIAGYAQLTGLDNNQTQELQAMIRSQVLGGNGKDGNRPSPPPNAPAPAPRRYTIRRPAQAQFARPTPPALPKERGE